MVVRRLPVEIELKHVYKVFGDQPSGRALDLAKAGVPKDDVQTMTDHVVGLNDVNFSVQQGEIFVVMGLSGSGKSTAIRTVNKLFTVTDGEVLVEGTDVQKLEGRALQEFRRQKMGMVFQHFALFPHRSVIENTAYGLEVQGMDRKNREDAAMRALASVGLDRFALSYPSELSGGMQQRVGLARALAADPDILLMDEAFSALDPLIRRQMQDDMMEIQQRLQKTILFITHDLNEALRIGDRVCVMKDGAVIQIGTPEEILTQPADAYVADFVQDVDQGRVIDVGSVMTAADPLVVEDESLEQLRPRVESVSGRYVTSRQGRVLGLLTAEDIDRASKMGSTFLRRALRRDYDRTTPDATLNENYAAAGRGLPIAVLDDGGKLVGTLEPTDVLAELGRVEDLASEIAAAAEPDGGGSPGSGGSGHEEAMV